MKRVNWRLDGWCVRDDMKFLERMFKGGVRLWDREDVGKYGVWNK